MKHFILGMTALLVVPFISAPAHAATDIQQVTSPGGIHAWLVEEHSIPFVALELRFRGGTSLDAPGKRGAVSLMTALLEEGAGERDAQAFTQAIEELAASFSYNAGDDSMSVSAKYLSETSDQSLALLRDTLIAPRFDDVAIERVRGQVISFLKSNEKDPDEIARLAFKATAYGNHPYGTNSDGSPEGIAALTRNDIVAAHKAVLARDRLVVSAVGDITADQLSALVDTLLADLPETGGSMPDRAELGLTGGIDVVEFEIPQSVVQFGHQGLKRHDPDFFAAYILNVILGGGGFESRLMQSLREDEGLTYGVYSYLLPKDHSEVYVGSFASANDRVARGVELVQQEWQRMYDDGVTQEELDHAKTYLTGSYPLRFDGNGPIANILTGMQMGQLPVDYIVTRNDKFNAITLEEVNRVAKRLIQPENLHFTVVGEPEGLETTN